MRYKILILAAIFASLAVVFVPQGRTTYAAFHCMRIHALMGALNGDSTIQFVELRMNTDGQNFVAATPIRFYDSAGTLKATFTFPASVTNGLTGDSVLIATDEFNATATGGAADFTFSGNTVGSNGGDPLHPVQSPGGKVTFAEGFDNCDAGLTAGPGEVDSLAYGGATADFGSAAVALPGDTRALHLGNLNLQPADNSTEYSLNPVSVSTFAVATGQLTSDFTTPRNNGRTVLQLLSPAVGGIAELPDVDESVGTTTELERSSGGGSSWPLVVLALALVAGAIALGGTFWLGRRRGWLT